MTNTPTVRTCIDCGVPLARTTRGRPPLRCGECHRGRRRIKGSRLATCVDCAESFTAPNHTGALPRRCGPCFAVHNRKQGTEGQRRWRERHPEDAQRRGKENYRRRLEDPDQAQRFRDRHLTKYGLTRVDLDLLIEAQDGRCAICGGGPNGKGDRLHVDHCHASNKVRSLLCSKCNTFLGLADDSPERLEAAAAYLRSHRKT